MIQAEGLSKIYKVPQKSQGLGGAVKHLFAPKFQEKLAVDHVDLEIGEGEALAYIGSNGAGKSTTIKMLTGILQPSAGQVKVCGLTPHENRVKNAYNIGVMFGQKTQLWWDIPVQETFALLKHIYEIPDDKYKRQLDFLVELLDMSRFMAQSARQLSLGQRVRADLAAAFLHDPKILFLDEPTIGLDIMGKKAVRAFLKEVNQSRNKTILLSSHDLEDIREVCKEVMIIDAGRIIYQGAIAKMLSEYSTKKRMTVELLGDAECSADALAAQNAAILSATRDADGRIHLEYDPKRSGTAEILAYLSRYGELGEISISDEGIEDIVEKLYMGGLAAREKTP